MQTSGVNVAFFPPHTLPSVLTFVFDDLSRKGTYYNKKAAAKHAASLTNVIQMLILVSKGRVKTLLFSESLV